MSIHHHLKELDLNLNGKKQKFCDNAVVGSGCVIFPVRIGENAVIGAGSVVTEDVPDNIKVAGSPAKILGKV